MFPQDSADRALFNALLASLVCPIVYILFIHMRHIYSFSMSEHGYELLFLQRDQHTILKIHPKCLILESMSHQGYIYIWAKNSYSHFLHWKSLKCFQFSNSNMRVCESIELIYPNEHLNNHLWWWNMCIRKNKMKNDSLLIPINILFLTTILQGC
jgi:hypothetical protein